MRACRLCGATKLSAVLDLGEQALQSQVYDTKAEALAAPRYPLVLARCGGCTLLQLTHTVPRDEMYRRYWYRSAVTQTMRSHLQALALEAQGTLGRHEGRVLDIGCNDGTLLRQFGSQWVKVGVDPSDVAADAADDSYAYWKGYFPEIWPGKNFDLVISAACLYDLEDPARFAAGVSSVLADDGLWCVELNDAASMLDNGSVDSICFEHLTYFTLPTLADLAARVDLHLLRAVKTACNGGSVRAYFTRHPDRHPNYGHYARNTAHLGAAQAAASTPAKVMAFASKAEELRRRVRGVFDWGEQKRAYTGRPIHVLGASTKGNTLLQYCGLYEADAEMASERDERKWGKWLPGTGIPVVSEADSRARNPEAYLVMPYHFRDEIVERERAAGTKAKLLFPLPLRHGGMDVVQL